jgi:hypothetical protein
MPDLSKSWPLQRELEPDERTIVRAPITDDTKIVRYVGLSTLFLYLSGRAFIPSLRLLQLSDAWEGKLWWGTKIHVFEQDFDAHLAKFEDFIKDKVNYPDIPPTLVGDPAFRDWVRFQTRYQWWLDELAKRRCVWCWNMFDGPSDALWKLYGKKGAMVFSTIGNVKKALAPSQPLRWLVSPVRYLVPSESMDFRAAMKWAPYLSKSPDFRYEQELRLVFGTNPRLAESSPKGMLLKVDAHALIQNIQVSEKVPMDENRMVENIFSDFKNGRFSLPKFPEDVDKAWLNRYAEMNGNPFTSTDDPPGLFVDLSAE